MSIVVIETGHRRYGLVVDKIVDSEEIVVKPLGRHVKSCTCLAGATILGDGHVALILDAAGIAAQANLATNENQDCSGRDRRRRTPVQNEHRHAGLAAVQHDADKIASRSR